MAGTKKVTKVGSGKRRSVLPSAPEVKLGYAPAGRETLAAIEQELAGPALSAAEAPVIEISEAPAGRETLAAIAEELAESTRPRQNTLPYADRISNAPGARLPSRAPAPPIIAAPPIAAPPVTAPSAMSQAAEAPEITVHEEADAPPPTPRLQPESLEIFELLTFIVRGNQVGDLSSEGLRRRFVEDHLLHRLPGGSIDAVERIEVTPWTAKGTMVVRIWCKA